TTKAFTATIVGMLVDEGIMDWDDPVSRHLDWHLSDPEADAQLNLRDIMSHRTGLASMTLLWYGNDVTPEEVLQRAAQAKLLYPFREKWNYSNVCFLAAGWATAAAEDTDWHTQIRQRLLNPLGMTHTNTSIADAARDPLMSKGYTWNEEKQELEFQPLRNVGPVAPAGAINSSALDMAQWLRLQLGRGLHDGHRLVSQASIEETWTKHSTISAEVDYGLGWMIHEWNGRRLIEHAGGIDGFTAEVAFLPDEQVGYVLLMNRIGSPLQTTSQGIVFESMLEDWREADSMDVAPDDDDFDRYVGEYLANFATFHDTIFEVKKQNGRLAVNVPGQMLFELKAPDDEGKREFVITNQVAVRFNENDEGQVVSMSMFQNGLEFEVPRDGIEIPAEVELADVRPYLGKYRWDKLGDDVEVVIDHGRLAVDIPGQMVCQLYLPDEEGRWVYRVRKDLWIRFNRDVSGEVISATMSEQGQESELPRVGEGPDMAGLPRAAELVRHVARAQGTPGGIKADVIAARGQARMVHMGVTGNWEEIATADGRLVTTLDLGHFGRIRMVVNGEIGFMDATMLAEPLELEGEMLDQVWLESPFVWLSDWRDEFADVIVVSESTFDDQDVIEVRLARSDATPITVWVSTESWLPVGHRMLNVNPMGMHVEVTTHLADYREVAGGLILPHRITTSNELSGDLVVDVEQYEVDPRLDASAFARP
ncbi:MAG: beta-lactamase family protein, partial [Phycisphaerales bacterium]|nr:beta-lactamase family protein [Phycisphaerales bacterium]